MTSPSPLPPGGIDPEPTRIARLRRFGAQPIAWACLGLVAIATWFLVIVAVSIEI